jgi:hypothetical protein
MSRHQGVRTHKDEHPLNTFELDIVEWTPHNRLRHLRFTGIRSDKDARDAAREEDP